MGAIEKCRIETKQAMQGYDSSLIINLDETRFSPYANSNYSYQCTMADGSSFPRKEQNQKKSFTLLCGITATKIKLILLKIFKMKKLFQILSSRKRTDNYPFQIFSKNNLCFHIFYIHILYFQFNKSQFFSSVAKRGPEAKFSFAEKVLRKGGSVAKRGCCEKGYHRCINYRI